MNWINNLKIRARLMLAFGLVLAMAAIIGVSGWVGLSSVNSRTQTIVDHDIPSIRLANRINAAAGDHFRFQFYLIVPSSEAARSNARLSMEQLETEIAAQLGEREDLVEREDEAAAMAQVMASWNGYLEVSNMLREILDAGFEEDAVDYQLGEGAQAFATLDGAVDGLIRVSDAIARESANYAAAANRNASSMIAIALLLAIGLGLGVAFLVARQIGKSLQAAVSVADHVAEGQLDDQIDIASRDEVGDLLGAMQRMQRRLVEFQHAQVEMGQQFDAGDTDHRIDASAFPGAYGEMAQSVNGIVTDLNRDIGRGIQVMDAYARGDLTQDMDRLPGKKAVLTTALDQVKANLAAINAEIKRLAGAAAEGDFSQRGEAERFENDFRVMVEDLNELMEVSHDSLSEVSDVLKSLAEGDLTRTIDTEYEGVFGEMARNTNYTVTQLRTIVGGIQASADAINAASSEIAAGNSDLSRRTESQAASLEETASSMEELTSTVQQNAEHSRQARQLATGATDVATRGGEVVGRVVATMDEISTSSRRIEDIIGVIDGIAFQTNILALNAAVEAARAGEQGRGFAVVASEVRSLAQRSADAAKQIKGLINESVAKVDDGTALVGEAGRTMKDIVSQVQRVTEIISEIAAASDEQASGIAQVNNTVSQMDEVTQQNAALVEEASASARALEEQADGLSRAVAVFRLAAGIEAGSQAGASGDDVANLLRQAATASDEASGDSVRQAGANTTAASKPGPTDVSPVGRRVPEAPVRPASQPARPVPASGNDEWTEF